MRNIHIILVTLLLLGATAVLAKAPGRHVMKIAVLNYEPIMENRGNQPYWQACGWTDPRAITDMITEGIKEATDGALMMEVVHWTNVDMYPYMGGTNQYGQRRYTDETYWQDYSSGWNGAIDAKLRNEGYAMTLTNDFPHIISMVERGEVDHCLMFGGPYFGYWETILIGQGGYWCNSSPLHLTNQRLFIIDGVNTERPGTTLHNFSHGMYESGLGSWFTDSTISTGGDAYKNGSATVNDIIAFSRCEVSTNYNWPYIECGTCHFPPNGTSHYDYNNSRSVLCYADRWKNFPDNLDAAPEMLNADAWNYRGDEGFQTWLWQHIPRYVGFRRGRMNNWLTYVWNPMKVAYPLAPDTELVMTNLDLHGWYTFSVTAPPGTTQIVVNAEAGTDVYFALRKKYNPYIRYYNSSAYDDRTDAREFSYSVTINADNNFGKGIEGDWYLTFGDKSGYAYDASVYTARVSMTVLPKPVAETNAGVTISAPLLNDIYMTDYAGSSNINWQVTGLPQGIRAFYIAYQLTNAPDGWIELCADYDFNLDPPYEWFLPNDEQSMEARVRVIAEDVYGNMYTNTSDTFFLNTLPEPGMILFAMLLLPFITRYTQNKK